MTFPSFFERKNCLDMDKSYPAVTGWPVPRWYILVRKINELRNFWAERKLRYRFCGLNLGVDIAHGCTETKTFPTLLGMGSVAVPVFQERATGSSADARCSDHPRDPRSDSAWRRKS